MIAKLDLFPDEIDPSSCTPAQREIFADYGDYGMEQSDQEKLDKKATKLVFNFKESIDPQETLDPVLKYKLQDRKGNDLFRRSTANSNSDGFFSTL